MATFKCKMCGGSLEIAAETTIIECDYCGTTQTLPRLDDDRRANLYDRANHFRRNNEFDKAMGIYEQILNEDNTDAEAYWSLVLCRYGIEYVEDPASHKRIPTVNRAQFTSVFDDENYKSALQYSDSLQRSVYESEAKAINEIQKGILAISQQEEAFDVFICYKESDNSGRRTPDSVLAQDLYYQLTQEGFKVFFSRITLEDKLGSAYEPYIFAALNSAKIMVVLGSKTEYFNAVWVKNEWSRYLALIRQGQKKTLIPAYKDMDPYDLPEEFSHLQAQDMSKLGFMQDLIRGIKKIMQVEESKVTVVVKETVVPGTGVNGNAEAFMKRGYIALEDGEWEKADVFFEQVLNLDAECAEAYLGKLMAEEKIPTQEALWQSHTDYRKSQNYAKALRYAHAELRAQMEKFDENLTALKLSQAKKHMEKERFSHAIKILNELQDNEEARQMLEKAERALEESASVVLAAVKIDEKYGFINEFGEVVIQPLFDYPAMFSENGLFLGIINRKFGFMNESGEVVIQPKFDYAGYFSSNGLAWVKINDKYGYINESGEVVIQLIFDDAKDFSDNGLAPVGIDGKYGYINESGEVVIQPIFDKAGSFSSNGLACVKANDKYGYINESGEVVIQPLFDDAGYFSGNGLAWVKINDKFGYINESGEVVIRLIFDDAKDFADNGLACVKISEKWGFINESGEVVIQPISNQTVFFSANGLACVKINDKYGYINEFGEVVIQPTFDKAGFFSKNNLAPVEINGKIGYINESGEVVVQTVFDFSYSHGMHVINKSEIQQRNSRIAAYKKLKEEEQKRKYEEKRIAAAQRAEEERVAKERRLAEEREEKRIAAEKADRRSRGVCQYCGGSFKGLFVKTCTNCGKKKDY